MLKWKKLFVSLLSVSVIAGLGAAPVKAAQTVTPYTYKVTLSAGNKGTINGQQKVEEVDLAAGSTVSFDINDIKVSDENIMSRESVSADVIIPKHWQHLHSG